MARLNDETGSLDAMKGRTDKEGSDHAEDIQTDTASWRGKGESRHDGKNGSPQEETMMERILGSGNLAEAWKRVKANKGAPGIDGMTIETFPAFCRKHWPRIRQAIKEGTYSPAPVRRVFIPKPDGSQRPLGVPTVLDRVIQQAMAQMLGPVFEPDFSEYSYGLPALSGWESQAGCLPSVGSARAATPIRRCAKWKPDGRKDAATRWTATSKHSSIRSTMTG